MYDEHNESQPAAELTALEKQFADLAPTVPRIDRDRLMYDAGHAAALAQPRRLGYITEQFWFGERFWQSATALATAASFLLAVLLVRQHNAAQFANTAPTIPTAAVVADTPSDLRTDALTRPDPLPRGYLGMRYVALTEGVGTLDRGALPTADAENDTAPPANSRQLLKELLPDRELPSS